MKVNSPREAQGRKKEGHEENEENVYRAQSSQELEVEM
jgi:hypothetical protein